MSQIVKDLPSGKEFVLCRMTGAQSELLGCWMNLYRREDTKDRVANASVAMVRGGGGSNNAMAMV